MCSRSCTPVEVDERFLPTFARIYRVRKFLELLNKPDLREVSLTIQPFYPSSHCILVWVKKVKEAPLQAWSGPEGSRKLRFPDFMTTAQDGGKVVNLTHRPPLSPGNKPVTHFC